MRYISSATRTRFATPSEEERRIARALLMKFQFPWLVASGEWAIVANQYAERDIKLYTLYQ